MRQYLFQPPPDQGPMHTRQCSQDSCQEAALTMSKTPC